jgi:AraC-like DNA-binding protein
VDALSEVLRSFRLRGSIYAVWDMGAPWGMAFSPAHSFLFHYVQSGSCMLVRQNGERVSLAAGDVASLFDGAGHRICDSPNSRAEPLERILGGVFEHKGPRKYGGRRPGCRIICGQFSVDEHESGPASLRHLPPLVHIPRENSARVKTFSATLDLLAGEVWHRQTGSERAASLLTEMLFIQVVRVVLAEEEAPASSGWVQGLRDRQIGAALAAIHGEPERPWSVDSLASVAGLSRSIFAERFARRLGRTPMNYLAEWRLQLGARLLRETELSISEIFQKLGFASAASFDRAFKRAHRLSPSAYRTRLKRAKERAAAKLAI